MVSGKVKLKSTVVLFLLCLGLTPLNSYGKEVVLIIRPFSEQDRRGDYSGELLEMALKKTESAYGDFQIEYAIWMKWERAKMALEEGKDIHVIQTATRPHWERDLIPIRIPVVKGLLGYRIFLIRQQSQGQFALIDNVSELKAYRAGLGNDWSITTIFHQNGFNVVEGYDYEGLFKMLAADRFDYFPRAITEAITEYAQRKDIYPDLRIEKTLLLYLPLPVYIFVTPTKPKLAERIEAGLNQMIDDGSFDQLFYQYHRTLIEQVNINSRKVLEIQNPNLTPETPLSRKELWLDITGDNQSGNTGS